MGIILKKINRLSVTQFDRPINCNIITRYAMPAKTGASILSFIRKIFRPKSAVVISND